MVRWINVENIPHCLMAEAISLGALTMNVWMHVLVTLDQAVGSCVNDNILQAVQLWDDAVGFYTGIGGDPSLSQLYQIGEEYCQWFGTCSPSDVHVNSRLSTLFSDGREFLEDSQCIRVQNQVLWDIVKQMTIPLIQGALYHAYEVDVRQMTTQDYIQAEVATFAASLLPRIHACSAGDDASLIWLNTRLSSTTSTSFEVIKGALERQYECLGITCEEVGGIIDRSFEDRTVYLRNAEPCHISSKDGLETNRNGSSNNAKVGISIGVILLIALMVCIPYFLQRRRRTHSKEKEFGSATAENTADQVQMNANNNDPTELQMAELL